MTIIKAFVIGELCRVGVLSILIGLWSVAVAQDLSVPPSRLGVTMVPVDIAMDTCSMNPCPDDQECVSVASLGFLCRCPVNFVGISCSTECRSHKADIVFMLDSSNSLTESDWINTLYFVSVMILQLQVDEGVHRIAIITFGDTAVVEIGLDTYSTKQDILDRVRDLKFRQERTNTSGAIWRMRHEIFHNNDVANVVPIGIIITDGASTVDGHLTIPEAQKAKEAGIVLFAIGVTDEILEAELESIASPPISRHLYKVSDYGMLSMITNTILEQTCQVVPIYVRGATGQTGEVGPQGDTGSRGLSGLAGSTGSTGQRGPRGFPGDIGPRGAAADTGIPGADGPPGTGGSGGGIGATGYTGLPGAQGSRGNVGDRSPGGPGALGVTGGVGHPGATGPIGTSGSQGSDGSSGPSGIAGVAGPSGATGYPGYRGLPGDRGPTGSRGLPGQKGIDGPLGYIFEDANECSLNVSLCQHACTNLRVGYECKCFRGYRLQEDGHSCQDINECITNNGGCEQFCHNTQGTFACSCSHGYTLSPDTQTCMDVDECCTSLWPAPCLKSHICLNTFGSFYCVHSALIREPRGSITPEPQVDMHESVFLKRGIVIGLFVWLGSLTILIIICVILASSLDNKDPIMRAMEAEIIREGSRLSPHSGEEQVRVFPRMSLASRQPADTAMPTQDEINLAIPSSSLDRPDSRNTVS